MNNHMVWNLQNQSTEDIVRIVIDFLGEFLLYLSSIIECKQSYSQYPIQRIVEIAERVHQLRCTLLVQIDHIDANPTNSVILDLPSIGLTLQELALFIRCLCKEQQPLGTISESSHTTILTQLLDWIEKLTKYCMDCASRNSNAQCCQYPVSVINPYLTTSQMMGNPVLSIGCGIPCNESNICMPWSFFERMKNSADRNDQTFGVMYGIQDENVRQKLGYRVGKYGSTKRTRQKNRQDRFRNNKHANDQDQGLIVRSNDGILSPIQTTSFTSAKGMSTGVDQRSNGLIDRLERTSGRRSHNSTLSADKNSIRIPGSSRSLSPQQSPINSKQSSPLFPSHADMEESMRLHSIQDRLARSVSNTRSTANSSPSRSRDLPMTSTSEQSISQHPISTQISDASREFDEKSAQSLSYQSFGYQTPSKTTIKVSRESSQSLSPVPSKSNASHLTNISTLSPQTASINSMRRKKKSSSIARDESKRSSKQHISENPTEHPAEIMVSQDNMSNRSWEQRLASPTSITSTQRINSVHFSQNVPSPASSKQTSLKTTSSDSNFHPYSNQHIPPATSFRNETHGDMSLFNTIQESPIVEEVDRSIHSPIIDQRKERSTPQVFSINTYHQQSTSATYDSNHSQLSPKIKRHSFPSMGEKKRKFCTYETDDLSLHGNQQGYFHKFLNCFRRPNIDRSRYRNR